MILIIANMCVASVLAITWWIFYQSSCSASSSCAHIGTDGVVTGKGFNLHSSGSGWSAVFNRPALYSIPQSKGFYSGKSFGWRILQFGKLINKRLASAPQTHTGRDTGPQAVTANDVILM